MEEIIITPEIVTEICGYVRTGASFEVSALAIGFNQDQILIMLNELFLATDGIWKEFSDDILKAVAQFEVMQLMKINAEGGVKGSQWLLERVNPAKWEKKKQLPGPKKISNKQKSDNFLKLPEWDLDDDL